MKVLLIVFCIVLVSSSTDLNAQTTYPSSIDLKTLPAIPQINQPFDLVIEASFDFGTPHFMGSQMKEKDSIISIDIFYGCLVAVPLPPYPPAVDTIPVSKLNHGINMLIVNPYCVNEFDTYNDTLAKGDADTLYFGVTGISENIFNAIQIYPNPASENIFIENGSGLFIRELYLSDIRGRRIKTFAPSSGKLDISNLAAGQYILNFLIEDQIFSRKIVVK